MRVIAVDWSGAVVGSEKKIWLAEAGWGAGGGGAARDDAAVGGRIVRLECGRTRDEVAEHLIELAGEDARLVVGLDFAFSMPAWFMRQRGFATAPMLWQRLAAGAAERWLASCEPPFWGRAGRRKPAAEGPGLRLTDVAAKAKSVFQVGGAGSVGTGSLRGMCVLHRLREAGFHVWPFDAPGWPLAVEIYPRTWTRGVVVRSAAAREAHAAARWPGRRRRCGRRWWRRRMRSMRWRRRWGWMRAGGTGVVAGGGAPGGAAGGCDLGAGRGGGLEE